MTGEWALAGKTALVTGAAKRLGRATALALAEAGVHVVVHYRGSEAEATEVCREARVLGVRAFTVGADLAVSAEADALLSRAVELAGPIDILVNNASVFPEDTVLNLNADALAWCMNLHAYAPLALSRAMAAQGREGAIINYIDARVQDYDRMHAAYHLSKRALLSLTSMLALELAPRVRVNGVAPGLILPPEGKDMAYLEGLAHTNPLQVYGAPEDVTEAALFLMRSRFVTGQVIYVDGGRHLKGCVYG